MSISLSSARRLAVGAVGAGALAGGMLFGVLPAANAAPVVAPAVAGPYHVQPVWWGHHHDHHHHGGHHHHAHRHGGLHIGGLIG